MTTKDSMLWGLDQNSKADGSYEGKTMRGTEKITELKLPLECEREVVGGENSGAVQTWVMSRAGGPAPNVSKAIKYGSNLVSWLL